MQHAVLGLLTSMRISDVVKRGGDISVITHIYEKGGHGKRGEDRQSQEIEVDRYEEEPEWDNERDERDDDDDDDDDGGGGRTMKKTSSTNMS